MTSQLRHDGPWLDLCPVVLATGRVVRCTPDGQDVTDTMLHEGGVACIGERQMWAQSTRELRITLSMGTAPTGLHLELRAHPSAAPDEIEQTLDFRVPPHGATVPSLQPAA